MNDDDQQALVDEYLAAGKRIEAERQRRKDLARQLAERLGLSATARLLGTTRQSLSQVLGSTRPRGVPTEPSLRPLVEAGLLEPGAVLLLIRKRPPPDQCVVEADGRIRVGGGESARLVETPAAAVKLLTGKHGDGWSRLRSQSRGWATLAQLREELDRSEALASP